MELREFTADDVDDVRRFVDLTNAVGKVDSPWGHPATVSEYQGQLRHGLARQVRGAHGAADEPDGESFQGETTTGV